MRKEIKVTHNLSFSTCLSPLSCYKCSRSKCVLLSARFLVVGFMPKILFLFFEYKILFLFC